MSSELQIYRVIIQARFRNREEEKKEQAISKDDVRWIEEYTAVLSGQEGSVVATSIPLRGRNA